MALAPRASRATPAWLWLVPMAVLSGVILRLCLQEPLPELGDGDPATRTRIGALIREKEPLFRRKALKHFPGDTWSQADDFSRQELDFVRNTSRNEGMRPGAVLDAIDRDVKAKPSPERGSVPPCMPRPYYL